MTVHYDDIIMGAMASQIPASWLFIQLLFQTQIEENIKTPRHWPLCGGIHRGPVNFPHKWAVTRRMFPFRNVIMKLWAHITMGHIAKHIQWIEIVHSRYIVVFFSSTYKRRISQSSEQIYQPMPYDSEKIWKPISKPSLYGSTLSTF